MRIFPDVDLFSSTNWIKLDKDPGSWDIFIINSARKKLGRDDLNITLTWSNKDEDKGYGVGSLIVTTPSEDKVIIPVIIKNFRMAPLDVGITADKAYHLTKENLDMLLFKGNPVSGIQEKGRVDYSTYKKLLEGGPTVSESITKAAGIDLRQEWLDGNYEIFRDTAVTYDVSLLMDTALFSDTKDLQKVAFRMEQPDVFNRFTGTKKVFYDFIKTAGMDITEGDDVRLRDVFSNVVNDKISLYDNIKEITLKNRVLKQLGRIEIVHKKGPSTYITIGSSMADLSPIIKKLPADEVRMAVKTQIDDPEVFQTIMKSIEDMGDHGVVIPWPKAPDKTSVTIVEEKNYDNKLGVYDVVVKTEKGKKHTTAVIFDEVYDLNGKKNRLNLVIDQEGYGQFVSKGFKGNKTISDMSRVIDRGKDFVNNKHGLLIVKKEDAPYALGPLFILGTIAKGSSLGRGKDTDYAFTGPNGEQGFLRISHGIKSIYIAKKDKVYYVQIPAKAYSWLPFDLVDDRFESIDKARERKADLVVEKKANYYIVDGKSGYAEHFGTQVSEPELKYILNANGLNIQKIAGVIELANMGHKVAVNNVPGNDIEQAKELEKLSSSLYSELLNEMDIDLSKYDFVKIAAALEDVSTVDHVLGLNFLNPQNVIRFISTAPVLRATLEELVRYLIISRLGLKDLPEEAILQAIEAIEEILKGISRVKVKYSLND